MDYKFDIKLNKELRDAYNHSHFASMQNAEFHKPSSKKKAVYESNAANCICACLDRIDSIINHLNDLFETSDSEYKICDILSYGQTLIDCILILGKIFKVSFSFKNDSSCFQETGKNSNGNDDDYFRYIRSLCSVHPVETSRHANYQGDESEWSPWISVMRGTSAEVLTLLADDKNKAKKADYAIVVYRNDIELSKHVYISLGEVYKYLGIRYESIKEIITAIEALDIAKTNQLKNEKISMPEDFPNYKKYIENLANELKRRGMGDYYWKVNEWKTILDSSFEDGVLNEYLDRYKRKIIENIAVLHDLAQKMNFEKILNFEVVEYSFPTGQDKYAYCMEKTSYLLPCWENEDFSVKDIVSDRKYQGDRERLHKMLCYVEALKGENVEISIANRIIGSESNVNNAEWARVQIKWFDEYYAYPLDYDASDWYLYLQLLIIPHSDQM